MKNIQIVILSAIIAVSCLLISCEGSASHEDLKDDVNAERSENVSGPITNLDDVRDNNARAVHPAGMGDPSHDTNKTGGPETIGQQLKDDSIKGESKTENPAFKENREHNTKH